MCSSKPWCELRHYLGRLVSYRHAAETLVASYDRWPDLFEPARVVFVRSSDRMLRPITNLGLSAVDIIRNMSSKEESQLYLQQAEDMQKLGLDDRIRKVVNNKRFRPIVHAEVLVHSYLLRYSVGQHITYWGGWKYIGSSKPTCRLCSYYFFLQRDGVSVRPTHNNLYPSWRLPDINHDQSPGTITNHEELQSTLTMLVRKDAKRTLNEKRPKGKLHDSNTVSTIPNSQRPYGDDLALTIDDLVSGAARMGIMEGSAQEVDDSGDDDIEKDMTEDEYDDEMGFGGADLGALL
jgi:hypothetical protein